MYIPDRYALTAAAACLLVAIFVGRHGFGFLAMLLRFRWVVLRLVHCSLLNELGGRDAVRSLCRGAVGYPPGEGGTRSARSSALSLSHLRAATHDARWVSLQWIPFPRRGH